VGQVDGFLNFCKPLGWTSHDVVQLVRRRVGQRRVGHAGTLDPAATGVLPICLGRATRFADRIGAGAKAYVADVRFGGRTETCDAEGRLVGADRGALDGAGRPLELNQILDALSAMLGPIEQVPPSYSAIKVGGVAAYAAARRGEELVLPTRPVTIHGLAVLAWRAPVLSLLVRCSKGTYVRALARDWGEMLGSGAYLDALVRVAVGSFTLASATTVEQFEDAVAANAWGELIEEPDRAVLELSAAVLAASRQGDFGHGRSWQEPAVAVPGEARAYAADGRFLGLLRAAPGGRWQPAVSFVYDASANDNA
jgi:tRNA pseudouridine55 synthase